MEVMLKAKQNGHSDVDDYQGNGELPQEQLEGPANQKQAEGDQKYGKVDERGRSWLIDHDEVQEIYEEEETCDTGD